MSPIRSDDEYEACVAGWEWRETDRGIPYYVSESLGTTSWDHPYYTKIIAELDEFHEVHYAAYRTALKLRHLQKRFGLQLLSLPCLQSVMEDHGFPLGSGGLVDCQALQLVLLDMLHTADFRHFDSFRQDVASELLLNYLLDLFDPERSGVVQVKSVKLALAALSNATLSEKYQYFFKELQTSHAYIRRQELVMFVQSLIQIPDLLRESVAFGKNVAAAVRSCFQVAGSLGDGVLEDWFYTWLMREPQTFIWLPTLHRLITSETVQHECKCSICKTVPIVGFRYKCLQCFKFNLCQDCFFKGKVAKTHQLRHPMQEYCLPASAKDDTKAFMKIVRNKIGRHHRRGGKVTYLPVDNTSDQGLLEWQMRPIPPPPSPPHEQQAMAGDAAVAGSRSGSLDSGNSSENGGDGGVQQDSAPSSPAHRSFYDNSSSPARYLEERQSTTNGQVLPQEKRSLIHLVHRLRRENRLLRQQLREGRCSPEDRETWTSHATAEVTVELTPSSGSEPADVTELAKKMDFTDTAQEETDMSEGAENAEDEKMPSVLSRTISPIGEGSVTVNTQRYTSDFFNSILGATTTQSPGNALQSTLAGADLRRTPGTVLASTPADPNSAVPPTVLKTGRQKPPGLGKPPALSSFELTPVMKHTTDADSTLLADPTEESVTAESRDQSQKSVTITEEAEIDGTVGESDYAEIDFEAGVKDSLCMDQSEIEKKKLGRAGGKDVNQTPLTTHTVKGQAGCERRLLGKDNGGQTAAAGRKMSAPLASQMSGKHDGLSDTLDSVTSRRKSTGNLEETLTATPPMYGLFGTPDPVNFHGSVDALQSFDFCTPGAGKKMFAVSRGNSCILTPERQEIDAMIRWIDKAFPADLSYSALSLCHNESTCQTRMLRAAESIGQAMADLVQATADNCYM